MSWFLQKKELINVHEHNRENEIRNNTFKKMYVIMRS